MVRTFERLIRPFARRIYLMITRGQARSVDDAGALQTMQVTMFGQPADELERIQQYGFSGNPPPAAEVVTANICGSRDHKIVIAVDHRKFRIKGLESGEVAIYDDLGQSVILGREGIRITTPDLSVSAHTSFAHHVVIDTGINTTFTGGLGEVITVRNGLIVNAK